LLLTFPPISKGKLRLPYHFYVFANIKRPNFRTKRPISAKRNIITVLYVSRFQNSLNSLPSTILPRKLCSIGGGIEITVT